MIDTFFLAPGQIISGFHDGWHCLSLPMLCEKDRLGKPVSMSEPYGKAPPIFLVDLGP